MRTLITPAEVAALAFPGSLDPHGGFIAESSILSAQQKFLKPVLNRLCDSLENYPALLDEYVKPALAQWVRFLVLPSIAAQVGSAGIVAPRGQNFESVSPMSAAALRSRAKADARALTLRMVEYIEAHREEFLEYDPAANVLSRVSATGNVVL